MGNDFITRLASTPLGRLMPSRSVSTSSGAAGGTQVRQISSPSGNAMPVAKQIKVPVDEAKTTKAIVNLNDYVQRVGRDLHFSVDKDSGKTIIKVMDSETRQLIRQIPPEEVLALAEYLELAEGIESTGFMEEA